MAIPSLVYVIRKVDIHFVHFSQLSVSTLVDILSQIASNKKRNIKLFIACCVQHTNENGFWDETRWTYPRYDYFKNVRLTATSSHIFAAPSVSRRSTIWKRYYTGCKGPRVSFECPDYAWYAVLATINLCKQFPPAFLTCKNCGNSWALYEKKVKVHKSMRPSQ